MSNTSVIDSLPKGATVETAVLLSRKDACGWIGFDANVEKFQQKEACGSWKRHPWMSWIYASAAIIIANIASCPVNDKCLGIDYARSVKYAQVFFDWLKNERPDINFVYCFGYSMEHPDLPAAENRVLTLVTDERFSGSLRYWEECGFGGFQWTQPDAP